MSTLLTATLLLFLLWPAYAILLRYSDRYGLNRVLLLLAMAAVCALPFVSLPSPAPVATQSVRGTVSYLEQSVKPSVAIVPEQVFHLNEGEGVSYEKAQAEATSVNTLPLIYGFGLGLMLLVLGVRLLLILALHLRSRLNQDGTYRLLHPGASPGQAFTFGRNLYFSEDVIEDADFQHILDHERVHARQGHTLDILLSEFFLCLFWFHPAAWWLRNRMRANLEYLVDKAVVTAGADRRDYQLALVRQSQGAYGLALALPFSEPTLKSRIARMTGLPEYRVVAVLAAVALVFWLGVTLLVVNGTVFGDEPLVGREYLEAAAHPGDPYYEHYQNTLPEELTSLEIYTSRMVTVDEYLQLRAILGKVPGAKLFVYKNRFDEGYSLELRYGDHEPAVASLLNPEPSTKEVSILGIETNGGTGQYFPVSITLETGQADAKGSLGVSFNHSTHLNFDSFDPLIAPEEVLRDDIGDEPFVYVNRKRVDLIKQPNHRLLVKRNNGKVSVKLNGTEISEFGADDWPEVLVEARSQPTPKKRMEKLLHAEEFGSSAYSLISVAGVKGTYRKWYEDNKFPQDPPVIARYNDREVSLDFLLDTEFGENAMMQHGMIYNTPQGRYALQVLDDYPDIEVATSETMFKSNIPANATTTYASSSKEVYFYFRRLPTPVEVAKIRTFLFSFPGPGLRVFQDCKNGEGDYTLYFGDDSGTKVMGVAELAVGETYDGPLRFQLKREASGKITSRIHESGPIPENAPNSEVFVSVDGVYFDMKSANAEPYNKASLDPAPDAIALECKLLGLRTSSTSGLIPLAKFWSNPNRILWKTANKSYRQGWLTGFHKGLEEEGFGDRSSIYFINNRLVSEEEFSQYQGGENSYVRAGTWSNIDEAPVILEIVD